MYKSPTGHDFVKVKRQKSPFTLESRLKELGEERTEIQQKLQDLSISRDTRIKLKDELAILQSTIGDVREELIQTKQIVINERITEAQRELDALQAKRDAPSELLAKQYAKIDELNAERERLFKALEEPDSVELESSYVVRT